MQACNDNAKRVLYVFDIDRTLKPLIGPIPYRTKKAVRELVKRENVAIATGRSFEEALDVAKSLNIRYLVTSGGSEVYDNNQCIYRHPNPCLVELANLKEKKPVHLIYTDQGVYSLRYPSCFKILTVFKYFYSRKSSAFHFFKMLGSVEHKEVPVGANVYKIMVLSKYEGTIPYHHLKGPLYHYEFEDKANGVKILKEKLQADELICFGDSRNDMTLFQIADKSYAMRHGSSELKKIATEVIGFHKGIYQIVSKKAM